MALIRPIPKTSSADMTPFVGKVIYRMACDNAGSTTNNKAYIPLVGTTASIVLHSQAYTSGTITCYGIASDGTETSLGSRSPSDTDTTITVDLTQYSGVAFSVNNLSGGSFNVVCTATLNSLT